MRAGQLRRGQAFYNKLPLREVRRRQDLVHAQQRSAFQQLRNATGHERQRLERGMRDLDIMDRQLQHAAARFL